MIEKKLNLAYLASGSGSSVEALDAKTRSGLLKGFNSKLIICNKAPGNAGIYERAERLGIDIMHASNAKTQLKALKDYNIDLVLGLGYIQIVDDTILNEFKNRVLNIHPTLLPKYGGKGMYGLATHMAVLESGDTHTGPTVHLMSPEYDQGLILRQAVVPVPFYLIGKPSKANAEELQQYVLNEEYQIMPEVLLRIKSGVINLGF